MLYYTCFSSASMSHSLEIKEATVKMVEEESILNININ